MVQWSSTSYRTSSHVLRQSEVFGRGPGLAKAHVTSWSDISELRMESVLLEATFASMWAKNKNLFILSSQKKRGTIWKHGNHIECPSPIWSESFSKTNTLGVSRLSDVNKKNTFFVRTFCEYRMNKGPLIDDLPLNKFCDSETIRSYQRVKSVRSASSIPWFSHANPPDFWLDTRL